MQTFIKRPLKVTLFLYALFHFITTLCSNELLLLFMAISGIAFFIFTSIHLSIPKCKLPFTIFVISLIVMLTAKMDILHTLQNGAIEMRHIIGLLIVVPLISYVLQEEPYIEDVMGLFYRFINTGKKFYFTLLTFTQIIAYFLLFGSITMMYQFVQMVLHEKTSENWEYFKGTALLRAFGLSTLWVVSIPSFVYAVETLNASLWLSILQGFIFAICGSFLAMIFMSIRMKRANIDVTTELQLELQSLLKTAANHEVQVKKTMEFSLLFVSLFGTIFLLHGLFHFQLMVLIPLVIIGWMFFFYVWKGKLRKFFVVIKDYASNKVVGQSYQLSLMISVGVLINALHGTNFSTNFIKGLHAIQAAFPFINFLYILPFIVILLGFCGLGPLTVMVLVAGILQSMPLPYPPELMVLAITSGSAISIFISPIVMPVIVLSASNGLGMLTNGIKFNWKFALSFYVMIQLYIQVMYQFVY